MLTTEILRYGYVLLFIAAAVEGDASLMTATFLAHLGYFSLGGVIATAAAATCCANQVYYWLGRRHARSAMERLHSHRFFGWMSKALAKHAPLLLFVSRFLYGLRIAIPLSCGAAGMSPILFVGLDIAGSALWSTVIGLAGWAVAHSLVVAIGDIRRHEGLVALGVLAVVLIILSFRGSAAVGRRRQFLH
jgi:membrane protein DedA with SNARE-associated domain